jgi:hypothetical protein
MFGNGVEPGLGALNLRLWLRERSDGGRETT